MYTEDYIQILHRKYKWIPNSNDTPAAAKCILIQKNSIYECTKYKDGLGDEQTGIGQK